MSAKQNINVASSIEYVVMVLWYCAVADLLVPLQLISLAHTDLRRFLVKHVMAHEEKPANEPSGLNLSAQQNPSSCCGP